MLTKEILKNSPALAALTEEQITAITTLSTNDENAVIAKKVGDIHGQYDRDIEAATGLKKPEGTKTYEWMKTDVLPKVKATQDVEVKLATALAEKTTLEEQVKNGKVDEVVKQQLIDANKLVADLQKKATEDKATYDKSLLDVNTANAGILVNNEFDKALVGQKFKDDKIISPAVRDSFIANAKLGILAENKPDWIDNGAGGKTLIFRDAQGEIKRNSANGLNPFTASELFLESIGDVLDQGKKQPGAGSKAPGGGGGGGATTLDLSSAKNQVEADELATTHLMEKGLTRGSADYESEFAAIREENKVSDLPIR